MTAKAVAYSNNDVSFLAWRYDTKIPQCLGFAVFRTDLAGGDPEPLPAWVGFEDQHNANWKPRTTKEWPIQKFSWRDLTAKRGHSYQYKVVPMVGAENSLKPLENQALTTNSVTLLPKHGSFSVYFNRGILSTQSLARQLPSGLNSGQRYEKLADHIDNLTDPLRLSLAGQLLEALPMLLKRADDEDGQCYLALYELNDPGLLKLLTGNKRVHLILSNSDNDNMQPSPRQTLHDSHIDIQDRMLKSGHIGHNKFVVYADKDNKAQAVLTGSTNWTDTALCAQSNNALIIESPELAAFYLEYWHKLKHEGSAQEITFRSANNHVHEAHIDGTGVHLWFSPNTKQQSKPATGAAQPSDLSEVFSVIDGAKHGIMFLVFEPGTPSIMTETVLRQNADATLFIRGAATDIRAVQDYDTTLYHRAGQDPDTVVAAADVTDQFSFWQQELLKSSPGAHAIIHDKIVVIDPLSPDCAVIMGSHNMGYRASYNNDENLLILRGNQALAQAYAVHVMDIYDHYRWRYTLQTEKAKAWSFLAADDSWQDKYFNSPDITREVKFWVGD